MSEPRYYDEKESSRAATTFGFLVATAFAAVVFLGVWVVYLVRGAS